MAEIPAGHVGGVTALAVTVTGVATELPLAGAVTVTMPFEVEARADEAHSKSTETIDFMVVPGGEILLVHPCRIALLRSRRLRCTR